MIKKQSQAKLIADLRKRLQEAIRYERALTRENFRLERRVRDAESTLAGIKGLPDSAKQAQQSLDGLSFQIRQMATVVYEVIMVQNAARKK